MSASAPANVPPSPSHGPLRQALLGSLVIHGVVLTLGIGIAYLAGHDARSPAPAAHLAARLQRAVISQPPVVAPAAAPPLAPPLPSPASRPTKSSKPSVADRPPRPIAAPHAGPAGGGVTENDAEPRIDPGSLLAYRLTLGRAARLFHSYPPGLLASGIRGRVTLRLAVGRDGQAPSLRISRSSGHPELDQAALTMMTLAARHSRLPDNLLGQAFSLDLAVDFSPDDQP